MKFILKILIVGLVCCGLQMFAPWWIIAPACFLVGALAGGKPFAAFLFGLLGVALLWGSYAFYLDSLNGSLLSSRLIQLFPIGSNGLHLVLITATVGGIVGGMAALSGNFFRSIFTTRRRKDYLIR